MGLQVNSIAAAVGASVKNVSFKPAATNLPRKILVVGTYDPLKTAIIPDVPAICLNSSDAGYKYGFGSMLHRLAVQVFTGSNGVETWIVPQEEAAGAVNADGSLLFVCTSATAGTLYLYIAGLICKVNIATGDDAADIATAVVAAITADKNLPVSAAVNGVVDAQVDITAKSAGTWGNSISLAFNLGSGELLPTGVTCTVTPMASGAGIPDIADALDALGTGDGANENWFTDVVHGYGQDDTTLDAILTYVGAGNDYLGLYEKLVARPFRVLTGDVVAGSGGYSALIALGDGRKTDRANGVVAVPGSHSHPSEIAAQTIGHMARINNDVVAQHYNGIQLVGIDPGEKADRWTDDYDSRDTDVKTGISTTRVINGVVTLQNVVSFYHPDDVPVESNGYRSMRNISILQNILYNVRVNFEREKWQGISIVADTAAVTNPTDRKKARDIDSVLDDLVALAKAFESKAWIYTADFTINKLKGQGAVAIRSGALGFDSTLSVILSGEGGILDAMVEFDTSLAVLTA